MTEQNCKQCRTRPREAGEEFCGWACTRDYFQHTCGHCRDDREARRLRPRPCEERYSFGCYAGKYCDQCWRAAGYRDAIDHTARFDPADAGERIDDDY